jgi:alpha/beta superfamily hydrolase
VSSRPLDLNVPDEASAAALLLHPHPDMGGDRFNHVVEVLFRRLPSAGIATARFDFSSSDLGVAGDEVVAAIDALSDEVGELPLLVVGYSFGGRVAANADDGGVTAWCLIAAPLEGALPCAIAMDPRPKHLAVPEHDFTPPDRVAELTRDWVATTRSTIAGADHFLGGATAGLSDEVASWARSIVDR